MLLTLLTLNTYAGAATPTITIAPVSDCTMPPFVCVHSRDSTVSTRPRRRFGKHASHSTLDDASGSTRATAHSQHRTTRSAHSALRVSTCRTLCLVRGRDSTETWQMPPQYGSTMRPAAVCIACTGWFMCARVRVCGMRCLYHVHVTH